MPSGTLEILARELALAFDPLKERLAPDKAEAFIAELGLRLPSGFTAQTQAASSIASVVASAAGLAPLIVQLTDAIDDDQPGQIVSSGSALLGKIVDVITGLADMRSAFDALASSFGGLTPDQRAALQDFAQELPRRLIDYSVVQYLRSKGEFVIPTLSMVGLLDNLPDPGIPGNPLRPPYIRRAFNIGRFVDLFLEPDKYLLETFGWGDSGFDGSLLFPRLKEVLEHTDMPVALITPPGLPSILEAYIFRLSTDPAISPPALTFRLRTPATQDFERSYSLTDLLALTLSAKARFEAGLDGTVRLPLDITLLPTGTANADVRFSLVVERGGEPVVLLGQTGGSRLEVRRLALGLGVQAAFDSNSGTASGEPAGAIEIAGGKLVIDLSSGDGFISTITGGLKLDSNVDFKALWSAAGGLRMEGSAAVEIAIPTHVSLGPIEIQTLYLVLGFSDGALPIELSGAFAANLGPLKAAVDRIGIIARLTFPEDDGNLGPANLAFEFKPPNGVGLSLDVGIVKGGGYLFIDNERGEYAGALELTFANFLSLKAVGIITTRMPDGSPGFSLLIIITAEFGTGIQLGFGFTLLGVGGLLGLNRIMNLQPLMEGIRTGAVNSIVFPQNPVENAPRIISDLRAIFPPQNGVFLIGPMLKLGWGTPTLISLSVGVIIEIPGNIAILGVLKVVLPDEAAALIVIQVNFAGAIEFDKQRLYFFAALFESRVLFITFEGEMGLLVAWGGAANFVVSVGGFHPRFTPPPLPFPSPRRIAFDLANTPVYRLRVEGYFAVTSNTVQFGARVELFFGLDFANVRGHISFDALFQFSPFSFIIEISASLSVSAFGVGLFSVRIRMALSGPTPWRAKGTGSISLLFFDIDVDFDFTWGERRDTSLPPTTVMDRLKAEFDRIENWSASLTSGANLLVTLRKLDTAAELALHPTGVLRISQRLVPLTLTIDKMGAQKPSDARKFTITVQPGGLSKHRDAVEPFPMAQFQEMDDSTKLTIPAFQDQPSGVELSASGQQLRSSRMVKRIIRYELITIDTNFRRHVRPFFQFFHSLFTHFLAGNAAAISVLSQATRKNLDPRDVKVAIEPEGYAMAFTADNTPYQSAGSAVALSNGQQTFSSYAQAQEHLRMAISADPNLSSAIHIIPAWELNQETE